GDRAAQRGRRERRDRDARAGRERRRLVAPFERSAVDRDATALEQPAHAGASDRESFGEPRVETAARVGGRDDERALLGIGIAHASYGGGRGSPCQAKGVCEAHAPVPSNSRNQTRIQIMDTTLRDGEQTPDVAYTPVEKQELARLLLSQVRVDRIE